MSTMDIAALDFEADKFSHARIDGIMGMVRRENAAIPRNHFSHVFGVVDDCYRCLNCEVLQGGLKSGGVCPADGTAALTTAADVPAVVAAGGHPHNCPVCICDYCGVPYEFHKQNTVGDVIHGVVASIAPHWDYPHWDYDDDAASDRSLRDDFGYSPLS